MNNFSNFVDGRPGLLHVDPEGRRRHRRQPVAQVRARRDAARRPDRLDEHAVGHLRVEQGGEIKGARVFKNQMFIIVGSMVVRGRRPRAHRWAEERAVGTGFFNAVSNSYYDGERFRRRHRQRAALPGHVRHRDHAEPDHRHPDGGQLHARVAADHLQLLHRHDARHGRHVAGPHAAGVAVQDQPALPLTGERPLDLLRLRVLPRSTATTTRSTGSGSRSASPSPAGYVFVVSSLAAALLPYRAKALYEASPGAQVHARRLPAGDPLRHDRLRWACIAALIAFLWNPNYGLRGESPRIGATSWSPASS